MPFPSESAKALEALKMICAGIGPYCQTGGALAVATALGQSEFYFAFAAAVSGAAHATAIKTFTSKNRNYIFCSRVDKQRLFLTAPAGLDGCAEKKLITTFHSKALTMESLVIRNYPDIYDSGSLVKYDVGGSEAHGIVVEPCSSCTDGSRHIKCVASCASSGSMASTVTLGSFISASGLAAATAAPAAAAARPPANWVAALGRTAPPPPRTRPPENPLVKTDTNFPEL